MLLYAALDAAVVGLVLGAGLVFAVRRHADRYGALVVAVVGSVAGGLLGYALVAGSKPTGIVQLWAIIGGVVGAAILSFIWLRWTGVVAPLLPTPPARPPARPKRPAGRARPTAGRSPRRRCGSWRCRKCGAGGAELCRGDTTAAHHRRLRPLLPLRRLRSGVSSAGTATEQAADGRCKRRDARTAPVTPTRRTPAPRSR